MKETRWLNRIHYSDGDISVRVLTGYMGNLYRKIISRMVNISMSEDNVYIVCERTNKRVKYD